MLANTAEASAPFPKAVGQQLGLDGGEVTLAHLCVPSGPYSVRILNIAYRWRGITHHATELEAQVYALARAKVLLHIPYGVFLANRKLWDSGGDRIA